VRNRRGPPVVDKAGGRPGHGPRRAREGRGRAVAVSDELLVRVEPDGVTSTTHVAGGVLLIERGAVLVRVEGAPSQSRAIAIGRALR
jgi:hypothetical protein